MDQQAPPELRGPLPERNRRDLKRRALAARAALAVNVRCLAIVTVLFVVLLVVLAAISARANSSISDSWRILALAWVVHVLAVVVIGYPLGVFTSRLLPAEASLLVATTTFAAVGGVSGALLTFSLGGRAQLIWFALGAVTAGGARAWAHRSIRAQISPAPEAPRAMQ